MRVIWKGLALFASALAMQGPAAAAPPSPAAIVLKDAKLATGGSAWDKLPGAYEDATQSGARPQRWFDYQSYGMRTETQRDSGNEVRGYNGASAWSAGAQGGSASAADARTAAFIGAYGYYFPDRFKARARYLRLVKEDKNTAFEIIEVAPEGGRAVELWFDRNSHLLTRIVDGKGPRAVTTVFSDYRKAGKVRVPYRATATDASGKVLSETVLRLIEHKPVPRSSFDPLPAP